MTRKDFSSEPRQELEPGSRRRFSTSLGLSPSAVSPDLQLQRAREDLAVRLNIGLIPGYNPDANPFDFQDVLPMINEVTTHLKANGRKTIDLSTSFGLLTYFTRKTETQPSKAMTEPLCMLDFTVPSFEWQNHHSCGSLDSKISRIRSWVLPYVSAIGNKFEQTRIYMNVDNHNTHWLGNFKTSEKQTSNHPQSSLYFFENGCHTLGYKFNLIVPSYFTLENQKLIGLLTDLANGLDKPGQQYLSFIISSPPNDPTKVILEGDITPWVWSQHPAVDTPEAKELKLQEWTKPYAEAFENVFGIDNFSLQLVGMKK